MDSASGHAEKGDRTEHTFDKDVVDVAAQLTAGSDIIVDPETSLRLR